MIVVVVVGTICISTYITSAAPQGKGNDRVLSKIKFIHYRKAPGKPSWTPGGKPDGKDKDEGYYTYLAKGAKCNKTENFLLNSYNFRTDEEATVGVVESAVASGMEEWETPGESAFEIFGDLNGFINEYLDLEVFQNKNTISFRNFGDQNIIAQAIVWGYFGGPPSGREIIEAHIELNDDFVWGVVSHPTDPVMDLQNILTHELGHCAGMGDLYQTDAIEETMFGYSDEGETYKRDLYKGDIAGVTNLYE